MPHPDEQLVARITEQVLTALRARQSSPLSPGERASVRGSVNEAHTEHHADARPPVIPSPSPSRGEGGMNASIRPPAGVCTGDYSKFIELQNPSFSGNDAAARSSTPAKPQAADAVPQAALLHGIITAEQLQRAMAASPDGIAHLAPTARLTPLAQDLAREQPDKIHRASANAQSAIRHSPSAIAPPWLWWADGHCPAVQALTSQMRDRLAPLPQPRTHTGLLETVRVFQQRIREGQAVGGILFVESAALAMAYVNHCPSLRGVVAAHDETIEQGIRELGANVLVVEYPRINAQAITDRVTRFIAQPPNPPPTVLRELKMLRLMPE